MGEQVNNPACTGEAGSAISQYHLVKKATDGAYDHTAAETIATHIATQDAALGELVGLRSPSAGPRHRIACNGNSVNIAIGDVLVAGAAGRAIKLPAGAGTYYQVGIAEEAVTADGIIATVTPTGWGVKHVVT